MQKTVEREDGRKERRERRKPWYRKESTKGGKETEESES